MSITTSNFKKWSIVAVSTIVHLGLGSVYAWSFFQKTISANYSWSNSQTAWAFSISIFMLGITASWGGNKINVYGPRKLAVTGSIFYALGYIISYFALKYQLLFLLYLSFGVIGGIGLGLAYVTPVATVSKWFVKKQGLATGMVVMGFGLGALVMSKIIAPSLINFFNKDLALTFLGIGIILLLVLPTLAYFLKFPPEYFLKEKTKEKANIIPIIFSKKFIFIWIIFMLNVVAGMIFISFQSPLFQDILIFENINFDINSLESKGATLIAVSSVFNGLGRIFWGSISDKIGRISSFRLLLLIEVLIFVGFIFIKSSTFFFVGVCIILLNYGGGFGVLPSLIKDFFGEKSMSSVYGLALTAWGVGGIIGPQITAYMKDYYGLEAAAQVYIIALILITVGTCFALILKK